MQVRPGCAVPEPPQNLSAPSPIRHRTLSAQQYLDGILRGDRTILAQAITLIESSRGADRQLAERIVEDCLPHSGNSLRVGITGVPGAGKSSLIEVLGTHLICEHGQKVAVLAIDPSSQISGGSILGDKTRMSSLASSDMAFIRPSPSRGSLGGVAQRTREAMLLCEAAGFDVIIVETVGVGQSETAVAGMSDVFVLLQLPNAGDELQAIKKGIVELADIVVVNKADIDPAAAERACGHMRSALSLLRPSSKSWQPPVLAVSAARNQGIDGFWRLIENYRNTMQASGEFEAKRRRQAQAWMWALIESGLSSRFRSHPAVRAALPELSSAVEAGMITPAAAANQLLAYLKE